MQASRCVGYTVLALLCHLVFSSGARASSTPQIVDDFGDLGTRMSLVANNVAKVTWNPRARFYMTYDRHVKSNVVQLTLLKDGEAVGTPWVCRAQSSMKAYQRNQQTGSYPYPLSFFDCMEPKKFEMTDGGDFQLALKYKETLLGKEHDLGTLSFRVIEVAQGSRANPKKYFALDWDSMLGTATVFEDLGRKGIKDIAEAVTRAPYKDFGASNQVVMSFWTKYERQSDPGSTQLTCLKGDEIIKESRNATGESHGYSTYNSDKSESVVEWRNETFTFKQLYMRRKSPEAQMGGMGAYFLAEHPGDYRCIATAGGEITAELRFTIDADGELVGRDCGSDVNRPDTVHEVIFEEKGTTSFAFDPKAGNAPYFGRAKKSSACRR